MGTCPTACQMEPSFVNCLEKSRKKYISCIAGVLSVHKLTFKRLRVCLCSFNVVAKAPFIISLVDMFSQDFAKVSKGQTATSWSCSSSNLRACDMGTLEEALELCVSGIQPYANTAHDGWCNRALMPIPWETYSSPSRLSDSPLSASGILYCSHLLSIPRV